MPSQIRIAVLFLGLLVAVPAALRGGPTQGPRSTYLDLEPNGSQIIEEKFQGGHRACFIALAVGENATELNLTVYDSQGRTIDTDQGKRTAVIWYPPRDAEYKIEVRNPSSKRTKFYMAVK